MRFGGCGAVLVLVAMTMPGTLSAQTMITLEVPVNLTKLSSEVTQVEANCNLISNAITTGSVGMSPNVMIGRDRLTVLGGQLVSTFRVVFEIPASALSAPIGKTAEYQCNLVGYTSKGAAGFSEDDPTSPMYMKPAPKTIVGTFVW